MVRVLGVTCALLLAAPAAWAEDPLKSAACERALAQLDAARQARAADTEARRTHAARQCLGEQQPAPVRNQRWAQPPVSVPGPSFALPRPPAPAALPPAVAIERPSTAMACDIHGCWTNDGTRLQRIAPAAPGPGGSCSVQGAFAYCP